MKRALLVAAVAFGLGCTETEYFDEEPVGVVFGVDSLVLSPEEGLSVTVLPVDEGGNVIPLPVARSSSDTTVFRVSGPDSIVAIAPGNAYLVAASGDLVDSIPVRVVSNWVGGDVRTAKLCLLRGNGQTWCAGDGAPFGTQGFVNSFVSMTAGGSHQCAIDGSGAAWCWGSGAEGQLGIGDTIGGSLIAPGAVVGGHQFAELSGGFHHTCGRTTDGVALCWGDGADGGLGNGDTVLTSSPDTVAGGHLWTKVVAGYFGACGISDAAVLYCWGSAIPAADSLVDRTLPQPIGGVGPVTDVALTEFDGVCALQVTDVVMCWGYLSPNWGPIAVPTQQAAGSSFTTISAGSDTFCGLDGEGQAWCWGGVYLGDGSVEASSAPVQVDGGHRFASLFGGGQSMCGLTTGGAAYCWGYLFGFSSAVVPSPRRMPDP